nr:cation/H+ exchanger, cation/H+ exchanger, CPA1 family [Tanacetum cinerariifolium]
MSYAKQLRSITHEDEDCFLVNITCCNGKVYALHSKVGECDDFVIEVQIVVKEKEVRHSGGFPGDMSLGIGFLGNKSPGKRRWGSLVRDSFPDDNPRRK